MSLEELLMRIQQLELRVLVLEHKVHELDRTQDKGNGELT